MAPRLHRPFFARPTLAVARGLLGARLVHLTPEGLRLSGLVAETEAYVGSQDLACHARSGRTSRNASLWGPPGQAYVYFTYGVHWLLNVVTEVPGFPAAVLIRSLCPAEGLEVMRRRRGNRPDRHLTDGPAKLCQALGIDGTHDGLDLCAASSALFLEAGPSIPDALVARGPRVGLGSVPEPWESIRWNFRVRPGTFPDSQR